MEKAIIHVQWIVISMKKILTAFLERKKKPLKMNAPKDASAKEPKVNTVIDLVLKRFCYHPKGTLGVIEVDGEKFYTVERPWLNNKPNVSCIPTGTYDMGWRDSPRFGETWHVKDVEDRTYILIHVANFPTDVMGCIGLGTSLMGDRIAVSNSRVAVKRFEELTKDKEWRLTVSNVLHAALPKT